MFISYNVLVLCLVLLTRQVLGWEYCQNENKIVCPDYSTCCKNGCIPTRHAKDPDNSGQCCNDYDGSATTGCGYGFVCDVRKNKNNSKEEPYCHLDRSNPPGDLFHDQPRYQLCRISNDSTGMHGFPIPNATDFKLAYYSSHGPIVINHGEVNKKNRYLLNVKKVLIMIHGSGRNADDYFWCQTNSTQ